MPGGICQIKIVFTTSSWQLSFFCHVKKANFAIHCTKNQLWTFARIFSCRNTFIIEAMANCLCIQISQNDQSSSVVKCSLMPLIYSFHKSWNSEGLSSQKATWTIETPLIVLPAAERSFSYDQRIRVRDQRSKIKCQWWWNGLTILTRSLRCVISSGDYWLNQRRVWTDH